MLDLVILLSIALGITALLGLLLAGFVWMPWLVGVLLVALLAALVKLSIAEPESDLDLSELELGDKAGLRVFPAQAASTQASPPQVSSSQGEGAKTPRMVYRGVKYQRPQAVADASNQKGLYRGQPWQR